MPLVSRTSTQGNFFKEDDEPPNWLNGDLWSDTNSTPRILSINDDGTALALGTLSFDESDSSASPQTSVDGFSQFLIEFTQITSFQVRASVTVTPDTARNIVILSGGSTMVGAGGLGTWTTEISEVGSEVVTAVTSTFNTDNATLILKISGTLTDVTAAAHTYDIRSKSSVDGQIHVGPAVIFAAVIL